MTQHELITEYVKEFGSIVPAKVSGKIYKGQMLGSESSKRCRELRKRGRFVSVKEGKFEKFMLSESYKRSLIPRKVIYISPTEVRIEQLSKELAENHKKIQDKLV